MKGIWNKSLKKNIQREDGMMVVEAVISFSIFIIVTLSIVYLINIFTVHNKIQFAINSAAHEIAGYSYLYEALGVRGANKQVQEDGDPYASNVDNTVTQVADSLNRIQGLYSDFGNATSSVQNMELNSASITNTIDQFKQLKSSAGTTVQSVKTSAASVKNLFSDGNGLLAGIIFLAISDIDYGIKNIIGTAAASALTEKYLEGKESADEYLKGYGILDGYEGLDFSGSTIFCDSDMRVIDIVVEYDIDLGFAKILIPEAKLHVIQRVSVPAWLNGDGQTVPQ